MNSSYYQNQINRLEKDIADLQKKIADENKKEIDKNKQIDSVHRTINKNTSISTLNSKQRQIDGYQKDILNCRTKIASYQKSIATKSAELGKKRQELLKAQQSEQKKLQDDQLKFQKKLQSEIEIQKRHLETLIAQNYSTQNNKLVSTEDIPEPTKQYDFFISHASEDKDDIVRDSFVKKNWTEYELNGMVAREMNGHKVILPIWHKITKDEVLRFSPSLADKLALNTSIHTIDDIVENLKNL